MAPFEGRASKRPGAATTNPDPVKDFSTQVFANVWASTGWIARSADQGMQVADSFFGYISAVDALLEGDPGEAGILSVAALIPGPLDSVALKGARFFKRFANRNAYGHATRKIDRFTEFSVSVPGKRHVP